MKRIRSTVLLTLIAGALFTPPRTYAQDQQPFFRVKVDMVVLSFTVTDSKGRYINGLKPGDFRILEDGILNRTEEIGEYLLGELEKLKAKYSFVKEVRGIGLMIGMCLTIPGGDIVKLGHERGVLLNLVHDTVLRFVPPLVVTKQEIDRMIAEFARRGRART